MRLLLNENVPKSVLVALQARGHDAAWVRTDAPGSSDSEVLARAQAENRILVTFDTDFGRLAFSRRLPASVGVILLRIPVTSPLRVAQRTVAALESRSDWAGNFSVVETGRVRMVPLQ